jgi:hypothetical protein
MILVKENNFLYLNFSVVDGIEIILNILKNKYQLLIKLMIQYYFFFELRNSQNIFY